MRASSWPLVAGLVALSALAGCSAPAVDAAQDCFAAAADAPDSGPLMATPASDGAEPMQARVELRDAVDALYGAGARVALIVRSGTSSAERAAEFRAGLSLPEGVERVSGDIVTDGPVRAGECLTIESVLRASEPREVVLVGYASFVDSRGVAGDDHAMAALRVDPTRSTAVATTPPATAELQFEWDADRSVLRVLVTSAEPTPFEVRLSWNPAYRVDPETYRWQGQIGEEGRAQREMAIARTGDPPAGQHEVVSAYLVLAPHVPPVDETRTFRL